MRGALTALFDWSFATLALHRFEAQIHPAKQASRAIRRPAACR